MKPTIQKGDYVLVFYKGIASLSINDNDIVIINRKGESKIYVKRIFSLEKSFLSIDEKSLSNGVYSITHDPIYYANQFENSPCNSYLKLIYRGVESPNKSMNSDFKFENCLARIPENYFFVVGDNYNNSIDSRFWGFIHKDQIIGKVIAII